MEERMLEISEELAQVPIIRHYDVSLEAINPRGSVKIMLTNKKTGIFLSWVIGYSDSLEHLSSPFDSSDTITPKTARIKANGLDRAYFNDMSRLVIIHSDGSILEFKVKKEDRTKVSHILQERLGDKFKNTKL